MDLFAAAGRGAPFDNLSPPDRITTRRWTGPIATRADWNTIGARPFSLFHERKELILALGMIACDLWWSWCLGFEGRLSAQPKGEQPVGTYAGRGERGFTEFWCGLAYSPPRALAPADAHKLRLWGLPKIVEHSQGRPDTLYDSRYCFYEGAHEYEGPIRGTSLAELAARPHRWLKQTEFSAEPALSQLTWITPQTFAEFLHNESALTLEEIVGCKFSKHPPTALGILALIKARLEQGAAFETPTRFVQSHQERLDHF